MAVADPLSDRTPDFRLVGAGPGTAGLEHCLERDHAIVVGRHDDCTIVLPVPSAEFDGTTISRRHVVLEYIPDRGWCVYDTGSENGSAILVAGLPPAVRLDPGVRCPLHPGDVIELSGNKDFRLRLDRI